MSGQDSDVKRAWVARVLKVSIAGTPIPTAPQFDPQVLARQLSDLAKQVMAIGSPPDLMEDLRSIGAALKGEQLGMAADLLDETQGPAGQPPSAAGRRPRRSDKASVSKTMSVARLRQAAAEMGGHPAGP